MPKLSSQTSQVVFPNFLFPTFGDAARKDIGGVLDFEGSPVIFGIHLGFYNRNEFILGV